MLGFSLKKPIGTNDETKSSCRGRSSINNFRGWPGHNPLTHLYTHILTTEHWLVGYLKWVYYFKVSIQQSGVPYSFTCTVIRNAVQVYTIVRSRKPPTSAPSFSNLAPRKSHSDLIFFSSGLHRWRQTGSPNIYTALMWNQAKTFLSIVKDPQLSGQEMAPPSCVKKGFYRK